MSDDAIVKSRTDAAATSDSAEEIEETLALQDVHHHGATVERRPREDIIPAEVAAARTRTAGAIRVQALARKVVARRAFRMLSAAGAESATEATAATAATSAAARAVVETVPEDRRHAPAALVTKVTPPSAPVSVSTESSAPLSENDSTSSLLGGAMLEPDSTLSSHDKSTVSKRHDSVDQHLDDRSGTGVSSRQGSDRRGNSVVDAPGALLTQQPNITSTMEAAISLPFSGNHAKRVGDPSPTLQQAMVTLDDAVVWPVASAVKAEEATGLGAEELLYGGGQIIGLDGEVISSKTQHGACFLAIIRLPR